MENTFGVLICWFRVFRQTLEVLLNFVVDIVLSCCVLHNYLRELAIGDYMPSAALDNEQFDGYVIPGARNQDNPKLGSLNRDTKTF